MVRGVMDMKCNACLKEFPNERFAKIWSGRNTGKRLDECTIGVQYLYIQRDNCQ